MPATVRKRPRVRAQLSTGKLVDASSATTSRLLTDLGEAARLPGPIGAAGSAGAAGVPGAAGPAGPGSLAIYGRGQDGALHFDGTATVLGLVPAANTYTLTRDIWPTTCVIDVGVSVTGPYGIVGSVSLALNGVIHRNGNAGQPASPGSGAGGAGLSAGSLPATPAGGAANGGNPGSGGNYVPNVYQGTGGIGGSNATPNGGSGTGHGAGGGGGLVPGIINGSNGGTPGGPFSAAGPDLALAQWALDKRVPSYAGGGDLTLTFTGGGGGAGNGGGGSPGGMVLVAFPAITGGGSIQSNGGGGGSSGGAFGGGGGGGGGLIVVITSGSFPTCSVLGGIHGGGTSGILGGDGAPGLVLEFAA